MSDPAPIKILPCTATGYGLLHGRCPTCQGTGLLKYDTRTGELRACHRRQEINLYTPQDPYGHCCHFRK